MKQQPPKYELSIVERQLTELKELHDNDPHTFEFTNTMYFTGDHNKRKRQVFMYHLTGKVMPVSKCGLYAITQQLTVHFNQQTLF